MGNPLLQTRLWADGTSQPSPFLLRGKVKRLELTPRGCLEEKGHPRGHFGGAARNGLSPRTRRARLAFNKNTIERKGPFNSTKKKEVEKKKSRFAFLQPHSAPNTPTDELQAYAQRDVGPKTRRTVPPTDLLLKTRGIIFFSQGGP